MGSDRIKKDKEAVNGTLMDSILVHFFSTELIIKNNNSEQMINDVPL